MGALRCVDGSLLSVDAVACRHRLGNPYEITLALARDHSPFAVIGERCGFRLARLAALVSAAREDPAQAAAWPDPDDRFPEPECHPGRAPRRAPGRAPGTAPGRAPGMLSPVAACLPGD